MHPILVQEYARFEIQQRRQEAQRKRLARRRRGVLPSRAEWLAAVRRFLRGRDDVTAHSATTLPLPRAPLRREASAAASPIPEQETAAERTRRELSLTAGRH